MYGYFHKVSPKVPHSQILRLLLRFSSHRLMFLVRQVQVIPNPLSLSLVRKESPFRRQSHFAVSIDVSFFFGQGSFVRKKCKAFTSLPPLFFLHKKKFFWKKSHFAVSIPIPFLYLQRSRLP